MRRLIQQSLELSHQTVQPLNACAQMFRILADVKWVQSGFFETVSTSFASAALKKYSFKIIISLDSVYVLSLFKFTF